MQDLRLTKCKMDDDKRSQIIQLSRNKHWNAHLLFLHLLQILTPLMRITSAECLDHLSTSSPLLASHDQKKTLHRHLCETRACQNPSPQKLFTNNFSKILHKEGRDSPLPGRFGEAQRRTRCDGWSSVESDVEQDHWLLTDGLNAFARFIINAQLTVGRWFPPFRSVDSSTTRQGFFKSLNTGRSQLCALLCTIFKWRKEKMKSYNFFFFL